MMTNESKLSSGNDRVNEVSRARVFGIGLPKTGTTTLEQCLKILGYRCAANIGGFNTNLFNQCRTRESFLNAVARYDLSSLYEEIDSYNGFQDWPWFVLYKKLDKHYPGSKFILTVRESEDRWIRSVKRYSLKTGPTMTYQLLFGKSSPLLNDQLYLRIYREHIEDVKNYFKNRPKDLLILSWGNDDDWEKLCKFLNLPIPNISIPHMNKNPKLHNLIYSFFERILKG